MAKLIRRIVIAGAIFATCMALGWLWFGHASTPSEPLLKSTLQSEGVETGGRTRNFRTYVSPAVPARGAALLVVLHGTAMDGAQMRKWNGYAYDTLSDEYGFAVVYPDGVGGSWNDCRKTGARQAKTEQIDDVGFLRELIAFMIARHGIDPARVFFIGYSNGGQMAYRLLAEAPDMVAGAAVVASGYPLPETSACPPQTAARPVLIVHGEADGFAPYAGGETTFFGARPGAVLAAPETAALFARANGFDAPPDERRRHGQVVERIWRADGRPSVVLATHRGGHTIPQSAVRFPRILGATIADYDMPREAVRFLRIGAQP